jgi:hypothetical protein
MREEKRATSTPCVRRVAGGAAGEWLMLLLEAAEKSPKEASHPHTVRRSWSLEMLLGVREEQAALLAVASGTLLLVLVNTLLHLLVTQGGIGDVLGIAFRIRVHIEWVVEGPWLVPWLVVLRPVLGLALVALRLTIATPTCLLPFYQSISFLFCLVGFDLLPIAFGGLFSLRLAIVADFSCSMRELGPSGTLTGPSTRGFGAPYLIKP